MPAVLLLMTLLLLPLSGASAEPLVRCKFEILISSGILKDKQYRGHFTYRQPRQSGDTEVEVEAIEFKFRGERYGRDDFDAVPTLTVSDGEAIDLKFVGGPPDKRFAMNADYLRKHFPDEGYVQVGLPFFGYMNARRKPAGAGQVGMDCPVKR